MRGLNIDRFKSNKCTDEYEQRTHQQNNANDDEICKDLDHHSLLSSSSSSSYNDEAILTAEQVLEEIDEIMQTENTSGLDSCLGSYCSTAYSSPSDETSSQSIDVEKVKLPLFTRYKLSSLHIGQLSELSIDLEKLIQNYSEVLIQQLALRDELEYEKELKSTFISLVIGVQDKRHAVHLEKKKMKQQQFYNNSITSNDYAAKYLTTVIPYHNETGAPSVQSLQILIKSKSHSSHFVLCLSLSLSLLVRRCAALLCADASKHFTVHQLMPLALRHSPLSLVLAVYQCLSLPFITVLRAINEDSPTVPTLLTDYILKVICPTT